VFDRCFGNRQQVVVLRRPVFPLGSNAEKYDIIEADALRPTSAFAGNLYSYEYFQLLKTRLKPDGFAVSWRVVQTFLKVFPHVLNFDSVLGSAEPIQFDRLAVRARLSRPFTQAYYARIGLDVQKLAMPFFERAIENVKIEHARYDLADINSDLFPKDEYAR
jgi:hypothetical protein